ncbi:MAG TPA: hypothetical protein VGX23_18450 [Actinocrinis sp.]|nr:hypothetical protein [Actinocrinis sp.]
MDARTRKAAQQRDGAVARITAVTWRIGISSVAGAAILAAGFAHLLPTHLPHLGSGPGGGNGTSSGGTNGGLQGPVSGPGQGAGPGQVSSGGS